MSRHRSTRRAAPSRAVAPAVAPLGALAAGFGLLTLSGAALAQPVSAPAAAASAPTVTSATVDAVLPQVTVRGRAPLSDKQTLNPATTTIGKGTQAVRDIPQSLTVVTEKLMDDRHLDTMKEALRNTSGISFLAAEGGEEDIRLRGFNLQSTGDVFVDGMRDPAFYERDTFSFDRLEVLRGSASMLFGRGSTGGAVNMVNKAPKLFDANQVDVTVGSHAYKRVVGDFNIVTAEDAALRINVMATDANNNGAGSSLNKKAIAGTYRLGIDTADEVSVSLYHLQNNNGMNYGMPWVRPSATADVSTTTLLPLDPSTYYGMASDYNDGSASHATLAHQHRFDADQTLSTKLRVGRYTRDQRAGTVRFAAASLQPGGQAVSLATFSDASVIARGTSLKIQDLDTVALQSDYSGKLQAWGLQHEVQAGADISHDRKVVYSDSPGTAATGMTAANRAALYASLGLTKANTTVGTPDDGASVNEAARQLFQTSDYSATGWGVYAQDLVQVAPHWKLLGGLRFDSLKGTYNTTAYSYSGSTTSAGYDKFAVSGGSSYTMSVAEWSQRLGALYQPTALQSYHLSAATSFNTSGEAYSLSAANQSIPPEQSINIELGAKLDSADRQLSTRWAIFHSTKLHERNTDPLVTDLITLSGRRHVAGAEFDISGRITPQWEVFASYMWMPVAKIDVGVAGSEGQGTRPSLTPRHTGTVWSTYQVTQRFRAGGGLNLRSSQTPNRNPGWSAPGFVTADLMAEYQFIEQDLTVKANLTNVTNKLYAESLYSGHYIPGAGRMLQVTASLKF
ncbi:MAG: hypothetical protein RJA98_3482 [Pseudomonadota bacterium]|jgi:catecholate siderophore receptor